MYDFIERGLAVGTYVRAVCSSVFMYKYAKRKNVGLM
jgi:hypothetical protein